MAETDRLQRLEDAEAIRNLIASYGPLADSGQSRAAAELWTKDGEYDIGSFGIVKGRAAIAAALDGEVHQNLMAQGAAHILSPHHIRFTGPDDAVATGYSTVFRKHGESFDAWRVAANRWKLARQSDGCWLTTLRVNRLLNGDADARELLGSATGELP